MKVYYCHEFVLPLPRGHRFPMDKYRLLYERVEQSNHGQFELIVPPAASEQQLRLAHDGDYVQRVISGTLSEREIRELGFPWSGALVERSRRSNGATIAACRAALEDGAAASLAGGTHHAHRARAQGYCVFNDSAVASRALQRDSSVRHVLIADCDVHQGNGTAAIFRDDPTVFTLSIHGEDNFPKRKEQSDLDIALPDGTGDDAYLYALQRGLSEALAWAKPDLVIYLAGADPYAGDRLGRLSLTKEGLAARDILIYQQCGKHGLPVAVTMGGGYAHHVDDIVDIHYRSVVLAAELLTGNAPALSAAEAKVLDE
jgi:acetoin utilization deacetylase AcuC-like enzyme